jgi:hypothetical protein
MSFLFIGLIFMLSYSPSLAIGYWLLAIGYWLLREAPAANSR